jgi:DNA-binding SARP family transcriptional activator
MVVKTHVAVAGLDIGVLGSFRLSVSGRSAEPTAAKPRTLLAQLALNVGQVVPVSSIVEELWGDDPCRTYRTTIRTYVFQLRKLVGDQPDRQTPAHADHPVLRSVPGGYRLDARDATSDMQRYERLITAGQRAFYVGDFTAASTKLNDALKLWRGPVLVDVRTGRRLTAIARQLEESRTTALDHRIDADLRIGRHRELIAELAGLSEENPLHERLQGQFMVALYRSGRRHDALEVFQRARTAMIKQLGLEPSSRLRELQRAILTGTAADEQLQW